MRSASVVLFRIIQLRLATFSKPEFSTLEGVLSSPKLLTEKNQELTIGDRSCYR
jgi:hypothetical protein